MQTSFARRVGRAAVIAGPAVAILVAWATSTADDGIGIANAALALAFVCVAAALSHPMAGVTTSVVAALALNYFHTVPVHSLRMSDSGEIVTVLLLMALGLSVSVITTLRVRTRVSAHRAGVSDDAAAELVDALQRGAALPDIWTNAVAASSADGASLTVRLIGATPTGMPIVRTRDTASPTDDDNVVVPESGACIVVDGAGALVLTPQAGMGSVTVGRTTLRQFADHVASVVLSRG